MGHQNKDARNLIGQANMFDQLQAVIDVFRGINLDKNRFCLAEIIVQLGRNQRGGNRPHASGDQLFYALEQRVVLYKIERYWGLIVSLASSEKHITNPNT